MKKYLNPLNYFLFIYKRIQYRKFEYFEKKLYTNKFIKKNKNKIYNVEELIDFHFNTYYKNDYLGIKTKIYKIKNIKNLVEFKRNPYMNPHPPNRKMFDMILKKFHSNPINFMETGSLAHGTRSSMLFIYYTKIFGGSLHTVDINPEIKKAYKHLEDSKVHLHTQDSVTFLNELSDSDVNKFDLIYLDSYDLDFINPTPSQVHGLNEFKALEKRVKKGTLIAIDDTPNEFKKFNLDYDNPHDFIPGKGRLVLDYIDKNPKNFEVIFHDYAVVLKKL